MLEDNFLTFEEGCNKYLDNCRARNLREGTINHYKQSYVQFAKLFDKRTDEDKKISNGKATNDSGCWYFSSTKYKSDRVLEIDDVLYEILKSEKEKQSRAEEYYSDRYIRCYETEKRELTQTKTKKEIHFVCSREDGSYITPRTMQHTSRIIHNELNIKEFDYHSLRHTHATVLLENNAPLKYIQKRLGHKKIDVTINVYQHLTDDLRQVGVGVLNEIFGMQVYEM